MRLGCLLSLVTLVKVFGLPFISLTPSPIDTQWLAMDTGSVRALTGVATQGSAPTEEWVWLCTLNVRNDNSTWTYVSFISIFIYLSFYVYIYIYIYIFIYLYIYLYIYIYVSISMGTMVGFSRGTWAWETLW